MSADDQEMTVCVWERGGVYSVNETDELASDIAQALGAAPEAVKITDTEVTASGAWLTVPDWHGFSVGGVAVHIGPIPGRKSIALYTKEGVHSRVRAYFRSEQDAVEALAALDSLADALWKAPPPDIASLTGGQL